MAKREELISKNSPLEFKLHRLKFIDLVKNGRCKEALDYAKNFSRFREHLKGFHLGHSFFAMHHTIVHHIILNYIYYFSLEILTL